MERNLIKINFFLYVHAPKEEMEKLLGCGPGLLISCSGLPRLSPSLPQHLPGTCGPPWRDTLGNERHPLAPDPHSRLRPGLLVPFPGEERPQTPLPRSPLLASLTLTCFPNRGSPEKAPCQSWKQLPSLSASPCRPRSPFLPPLLSV